MMLSTPPTSPIGITSIIADVTPKQLDSYAKLIYEKIGVTISPQKTTLLSNRLRRRLRATGLATYDDYYNLLKKAAESDPEWDLFLQEVTTHETYLFRDQAHWDWLRDKFVPEIVAEQKAGHRQAQLRVWSAACSTGDEATTIACCLADRLPTTPGMAVEIVGTDVGAAQSPRRSKARSANAPCDSCRRRIANVFSRKARLPARLAQSALPRDAQVQHAQPVGAAQRKGIRPRRAEERPHLLRCGVEETSPDAD